MKESKLEQLIEQVSGVMSFLENIRLELEASRRDYGVKLSQAQADEIRHLHSVGHSKTALAKHYGVGESCIKNVIYDVNWTPDEPEATP